MANEGTPITNSNAQPHPSSYTICMRSGFRVKANELREEWNGTLVRAESYENRHPQDMVRARAELLTGSIRPESDDVFITTDIQPSDL